MAERKILTNLAERKIPDMHESDRFRDYLYYCHVMYPAPIPPSEWLAQVDQSLHKVFADHNMTEFITFAGIAQDIPCCVSITSCFYEVRFRLTEPFYWLNFQPQLQQNLIEALQHLGATTYFFGRKGDCGTEDE